MISRKPGGREDAESGEGSSRAVFFPIVDSRPLSAGAALTVLSLDEMSKFKYSHMHSIKVRKRMIKCLSKFVSVVGCNAEHLKVK